MTKGPGRAVWVLRHAKAAPHQSDDHARPLTGRGRRQCAELAAHLVETGCADSMPPVVLVSSAARARQTAELVLAGLGVSADIDIRPDLYRAEPDDVVELLRELPDDVTAAMVVGHNPTLEQLAWMALDAADDDGRHALDSGLSTGALAVLDFDVSRWRAVSLGAGRLRWSYSPKAR